jgi:hypothetical protein
MKLNFTLTAAALSLTLATIAQTNTRTCGRTPSPEWDQWFNQKVAEHQQQVLSGKQQSVNFVLPVIVHVIHGGQAVGTYPNISNAQVNSELTVLNNDFAGTGYNVNTVPAAFAANVANTNISFSAAMLDTAGTPLQEPGIHRVDFHSIPGASNPGTVTSVSALMSLFDQVIKPATIWDPTRYYNIWVSDVKNSIGILGYATFPTGSGLTGAPPGGSATDDGIWVGARFYGTTGTVGVPYNKGRTATHETGHYLGLRHIDGDSNCGNDYCNDTPIQQTLNYGCPGPFPKISCSNSPNGEMFMNFMDYSDDACLYMFTNDQKGRMQTAIANSPNRTFLTASSQTLCNLPSQSASADFVTDPEACMDSTVFVNNVSTGLPGPTYTWSASPSGVVFSPGVTATNPTLKFTAPGTYTVTLSAVNSTGNSSLSAAIIVDDCGNITGLTRNSLSQRLFFAPNPSNGLIVMRWNGQLNGDTRVMVRDCMGREVYSEMIAADHNSVFNMHLEELPSGVYFATVQNGYETAVKKVILDR